MRNRREFLRVAGAAGAYAMTRGAAGLHGQTVRREVTIGGRRVRVIDAHAHCVIPVQDVVKGTPLEKMGGGGGQQPARARAPADHGSAGRGRAGAHDQQLLVVRGRRRSRAQDRAGAERGAGEVGRGASRSVCRDWRPWRCSIPSSPPSSCRTASSGSACAAPRSAGTSTARTSRCRSTIRSGPRPPSSACWCSCIPAAPRTSSRRARSAGRGDLGNIIGNPLETTYFLSRLIFDGTFDKFPGLRVCRRACRRLPAVVSRADRSGLRRPRQRELREQEEAERVPEVADPRSTRWCSRTKACGIWSRKSGVGQVVYGTDVPFNWPVTVDLVLNAKFLSDADKAAILSGNLTRLLRIE